MKTLNLEDVDHTVWRLTKMQAYLVEQCLSKENELWVYHTQFSYFLKIGNLSIPFLFKAIISVLDRHPVLKTVFIQQENGEWFQRINAHLKFHIQYDDISNINQEGQSLWVKRQLLKDRNQPFDLNDQNQSLIRTYIVKRGENLVHFTISIHHTIWDGWSHAVLLKEIFNHYQILKKQPSLVLPKADYDYSEFIQYQEQIESNGEAKLFWVEHLKNHQYYWPIKKEIGKDYNNYMPLEVILTEELTEKINLLHRKILVTVKSIFLAVFYKIIEEETGQISSTIGVVTNGRSVHLSKPITTLGLLWNLAPICVENLQEDMEHIKNVNKIIAKISAWGSYPLLDIQGDKSVDNLFHATFNFINFENANILSKDADIEFLEIEGIDKFHFPLHLLVGKNPFNKSISLVMNYDSRCYSKEEIENKLNSFIARLEKMVL